MSIDKSNETIHKVLQYKFLDRNGVTPNILKDFSHNNRLITLQITCACADNSSLQHDNYVIATKMIFLKSKFRQS